MTHQECFKALWLAAKGTRMKTCILCVVGIGASVVSLSFVYSSKLLVDIATGHSQVSLWLGILFLIVCLIMQRTLWTLQSRLQSLNSVKIRNAMRHKIFAHLMKSIWVGKEKFHTGDMLNRMEEDVRVVSDAISNCVIDVCIALFQFVAAFVFLCYMDYRLAVAIIVITPIAILLSKLYATRLRRMTKEIRQTDSRVQEQLQENLQHRILLRTLEQTHHAIDEVEQLQSQLYSQVKRRTNFSLLTRTIVMIGFNTGYAIAFIWCIFGLKNGTITYGMMTAFLQLVAMVQSPILNLSKQLPAFIHAMTSVERVQELMDMPLEQTRQPLRLEGPLGVECKDVEFSYEDGDEHVLRHFNHDFRPGSITAIVGQTGVGKTTLIRLLLSLLQPQRGTITLYNTLQSVSACADTRCNMVYVPQGNTLLSGTIHDNLLMGKPTATKEEIREALHTAVADFVWDLPEGIETLCGEQGSGLSEGQAQRIAIARGLLRPGKILILDEPTSALDLDTENLLVERLNRVIDNKTVIIVTHRESILKLCQNVIQLNGNNIV